MNSYSEHAGTILFTQSSIWSTIECLLQVDQLTIERDSERSSSQKAENERSLLERQNAELRAKLTELESDTRSRFKASMSALEGRIANLEEQLEAETKLVLSTRLLNFIRIITLNTV